MKYHLNAIAAVKKEKKITLLLMFFVSICIFLPLYMIGMMGSSRHLKDSKWIFMSKTEANIKNEEVKVENTLCKTKVATKNKVTHSNISLGHF